MPRKGQRLKTRRPSALKPPGPSRPPLPDPLAHNRLVRYMEDYFEWMKTTGYSLDTLRTRRVCLRKFIAWCEERGLNDPRAVTLPMLERYQRHLFYYRKADGSPLTINMQYQYLTPLKSWFQWLSRQHHILANPAADLTLPRPSKRLPRAVLSAQDVDAILREAEPISVSGVRDRALLEFLYATGLRRMEVVGVAMYDVDLRRGLVHVRHGKGRRERMVPLGERAAAWLDKYVLEVRPQLVAAPTENLFLTDYGEPVSPAYVADKVKRYMAFAGIHKVGAVHLFRHACATHMLEGGADIRYIQEMLGHAELSTTEIYTHVSIDKLKEIHNATHPGARLGRWVEMVNDTAALEPELDE